LQRGARELGKMGLIVEREASVSSAGPAPCSIRSATIATPARAASGTGSPVRRLRSISSSAVDSGTLAASLARAIGSLRMRASSAVARLARIPA